MKNINFNLKSNDFQTGNAINNELRSINENFSEVTTFSAKSTLVDADIVVGQDSESAFVRIKTTWTNIKSFLKTYFDTLYTAKNTAIIGATKTKVTYDTKGLVLSGEDATTSDIAASTGKNYVTDAELAFLAGTGASEGYIAKWVSGVPTWVSPT